MKNIKAAKSKTVKPAAKVSAARTPAALRGPKRTVKPVTAKAAAPKTAKSAQSDIDNELIALRAYIIWEQQGRPQGHDVTHWLLAEKQLRNEQSFTA